MNSEPLLTLMSSHHLACFSGAIFIIALCSGGVGREVPSSYEWWFPNGGTSLLDRFDSSSPLHLVIFSSLTEPHLINPDPTRPDTPRCTRNRLTDPKRTETDPKWTETDQNQVLWGGRGGGVWRGWGVREKENHYPHLFLTSIYIYNLNLNLRFTDPWSLEVPPPKPKEHQEAQAPTPRSQSTHGKAHLST